MRLTLEPCVKSIYPVMLSFVNYFSVWFSGKFSSGKILLIIRCPKASTTSASKSRSWEPPKAEMTTKNVNWKRLISFRITWSPRNKATRSATAMPFINAKMPLPHVLLGIGVLSHLRVDIIPAVKNVIITHAQMYTSFESSDNTRSC